MLSKSEIGLMLATSALNFTRHGDVKAGADGGELLDGFQSPLGVGRQGEIGGNEQVAEGLAVRAPHAAAHLVQVGESETVGIVDDDGVGIGDVDAVLHDGGG